MFLLLLSNKTTMLHHLTGLRGRQEKKKSLWVQTLMCIKQANPCNFMFSNNNCILFLKGKFTVLVSIMPDVISSIILVKNLNYSRRACNFLFYVRLCIYIRRRKVTKYHVIWIKGKRKEIKNPAFYFTKVALTKSLTILYRVYFSHIQK